MGNVLLQVSWQGEGCCEMLCSEKGAADSAISVWGDVLLTDRQKLLSQLPSGFARSKRVADEVLISVVFMTRGERSFADLYGEFGFVLLDKTTSKLFLVRDHIGSVPLYYHVQKKKVTVSTNLAVLIEFLQITLEVDYKYISEFILGKWPEKDSTPYSSIRQVPPGHYVTVQQGIPDTTNYWKDYGEYQFSSGKPEDIYTELRESVENAVRGRMDAQEVGICLSGGLDSSTVTCSALKFLNHGYSQLHVFSKIPPLDYYGDVCNEVEFINEIVKQDSRINLRTISTEPLPNKEYYNSYFIKGSCIPVFPLFTAGFGLKKLIQDSGIKTVLSGDGGDEFLSNLGSGVPLLLAAGGKVIQSTQLVWDYCRLTGRSFAREWINHLILRYLNNNFKQFVDRIRGKKSFLIQDSFFVRSKYLQRYDLCHLIKTNQITARKNPHPHREMQELLKSGCHGFILEHNRNADAMFGYKTRYPLLDRQLIEQCLAVPYQLFFNNGWKRNLIRQSMKGVVPEKNRLRLGWSPFCHTFADLMRSSEQLMKAILQEKNDIAWDILERDKINKVYGELLRSSDNSAASQYVAIQLSRCMAVICFLRWLQKSKKI